MRALAFIVSVALLSGLIPRPLPNNKRPSLKERFFEPTAPRRWRAFAFSCAKINPSAAKMTTAP